ncbi:MAG: hypothetical protein CW691_08120 [Candidatus Bathyarchaeum sp.]|nr:MAG: hypothetical protein CW691_08120 [Candidatus Bathyarchaeum sp.]
MMLLLGLELFVCPVFPLGLNKKGNEATKISFPEAEITDEAPVFQKGFSYAVWSSDTFSSPESDESLSLLTKTNTEWVAICFSWVQSSTTSDDIHLDPSSSPTPESVEHAITVAHSLGLKVMLKPMVEAVEREEILSYPVWRGEIQPSDEWFASYSSFINFFAEFAEQNGVEMFCVGCEYKETTRETEQWKNVIQGVRERYSGPITYAADWTNYQKIEWWDAVDYVGIDAYFPLTIFNSDPTFEQLKTAWVNHADEIEEWVSAINKPVIFTEIGYRSGDGTSMAPSNYWKDMTVDLQEQNDCYEAAFQTLWSRNWFSGFYWWTWMHDNAQVGLDDSGHSPQNKPAQEVITYWYSLEQRVAVIDQTFTTSKKCSVNEAQSVGFHVQWEHDGADVADAMLYVNGTEHVTNKTGWINFSVSYGTVGERSWVVTDFEHPEASGYTVTVESPSIVWDKVVVDAKVEPTGFGATKVRVKLIHDYDEERVTGANIFVNGEQCKETELGVYEAEIGSWSPYQQVTIQIDSAEVSDETWSTTVIHSMNIIFYVALFVAVMVIVVLLLKWRNKKSSQPIEGMD